MDDSDLRLDGNSVAGLLAEVFTLEATAAVVRCASCGNQGAVGAAPVYAQAPGVVVRCGSCSAVLMRFAEIHDRVVLDMRGAATLTLSAAPSG